MADVTNEASRAASAAAEGDNKFQHAISAWRNVDLTTLVSELDGAASEIVAYQRDSTIQRKELAQKTKEFRKSDDATKLAEIKGLLKAYQAFIDLVTNHSKSINSAFLQAYTKISEAPDPYPLLEASVDSMLVSEDTLPKVAEENKLLHRNVSKLTSQLEESESRLEAERAARKELEDGLERKVREVQDSWSAVMDEKRDNWEAKEKSLEERIENQDRLLSEMKATYEVNQRLGRSSDNDHDGHRATQPLNTELEILHSEIDRTGARLADMEARNEQLRLELAQAKSSQQAAPKEVALEDDPGYMRMRTENSSLMRKLDASRVEREGMKRDLDAKLRSMEREMSLLKEEKESLKAKVQRWSDYDDVKQELEVLKSIEFSTGDNDDDGKDDDDAKDDAEEDDVSAPIGIEGTASKGDTLEKLLLARNKKLGDELTMLRVSHRNLQNQLEGLQEEVSRTNGELEKAQNLNDKLESDLEKLQAEGANAFPSGASVAGTYMTRGTGRKGRSMSPTSSIISGMDPRMMGEREGMGGGIGGGSGILPMVTAQRDRFKKRNAQLEQELSESHRTAQQLRQEVAALQRDNLNLYEKTRYISTYKRGGAGAVSSTSSSSAAAVNPNPSRVTMGGTGSPGMELDRYRKAYESQISPFAAFRGRESARAYRRMSVPERVVYSITRMVLASRTSRNLFAAYCAGLHVLVFLALYWLGAREHERGVEGMAAAGKGDS